MNPAPKNLPSPHHRPEPLIAFVLVAAGLIVYGQTLGFPFISLDDPGYVVINSHVARGLSWEGWRWAWTSFEWSNWHPLTWLSLMLDAQFYGLNAGGYHLTNLLLHLANALLLFAWLRAATGTVWPSAWTALFFVAHPMHVESVAWVTERKDVLSAFFFFLTLLAYTRYARGGGAKFYALALGLFALGLTAKPMLVTLPVLLGLLDFWPLRRTDAGWRRLAWEKLPFALLAAASCVVTFAAQRAAAVVPLEELPAGHRFAAAALGYGFYLWKTFWPVDLGIYYPYWHAGSSAVPWLWGAGLAAVTLSAARNVRRMPWLTVGWCWFVGMLVPVIGVVQVGGQAAADRYTYLPHVGLFIAVLWTGRTAGFAARGAGRPTPRCAAGRAPPLGWWGWRRPARRRVSPWAGGRPGTGIAATRFSNTPWRWSGQRGTCTSCSAMPSLSPTAPTRPNTPTGRPGTPDRTTRRPCPRGFRCSFGKHAGRRLSPC